MMRAKPLHEPRKEAPCPWCQGHRRYKRGCKRCHGSGVVWLLILLSFLIPHSAFRVEAASVTGTVQNRFGALVATNISFLSLNRPMFQPPYVRPGWTMTATSASDGTFAVNLLAGDYRVTFGGETRDSIIISVPASGGPYEISTIATNRLVYTVYPSTGAGVTANASYVNEGANLYEAKLAAVAAGISTIVVGPGTYTNGMTNLLFNGNWHFMGSVLRYVDTPTNTSGCGLFDDRWTGAVTSTITGSLEIEYNSGTNVSVDEICGFGYNTNAQGPIVITNGSLITWSAPTMVKMVGHSSAPYVLALRNVGNGSFFGTFSSRPLYTNAVIGTTNCIAAGTMNSLVMPDCSKKSSTLVGSNSRAITPRAP